MQNDETRVTTDKLAEAGLDFSALVQNLRDDAVCVLDPEDHTISWNEGAQRLQGYSADEIIGKHTSIFFTPEEIKKTSRSTCSTSPPAPAKSKPKPGAFAKMAPDSGPRLSLTRLCLGGELFQ